MLLVKAGKADRDREELFWPSLLADGSCAPADAEEALRMRNKFELELFQIEVLQCLIRFLNYSSD